MYTNKTENNSPEKRREVEAEFQERLSSEVETLKVQLQMLETELEISRMRAENAEEELRQLTATIRMSGANLVSQMDSMPVDIVQENLPPVPPPPPPMPANLILSPPNTRSRSGSVTLSDAIGDAHQRLHQTTTEQRDRKATGRNGISFSVSSIHAEPCGA